MAFFVLFLIGHIFIEQKQFGAEINVWTFVMTLFQKDLCQLKKFCVSTVHNAKFSVNTANTGNMDSQGLF